jgi:PIN domain nuclease of toxin-antitoxin system
VSAGALRIGTSQARGALTEAGGEMGVSAVSCCDLAQLVGATADPPRSPGGRLDRALAPAAVRALPLTHRRPPRRPRSAPGYPYPSDPFDRMILASSREQGARLVTADARRRAADPAATVW